MKLPFRRNRQATVVYGPQSTREIQQQIGNVIKRSNAQFAVTNEQLKEAIKLPQNENVVEWIAHHIIDFYNKIDLLIDACLTSDGCTCKTMSAGNIEYQWLDKNSEKYKIAQSVPAREYIKLLQKWIQTQIDEHVPKDEEKPIPQKKFLQIAMKIYTRMFRVFVHLYYEHFKQIQDIGLEAHLNTTFKHFIYFVLEFKLIKKKELIPLNEMIIQLCGEEYKKYLDIKSIPVKKSSIDFTFIRNMGGKI